MHIRALLRQMRLGDVDLSVLAVQLTAALEGPMLLYLSAADLSNAGLPMAERIAAGWQDLARRVCRA